jgi:hypothetical protein
MIDLSHILARLESLEKELRELKSARKSETVSPDRIAYFESLPADAVVGKDYAAYRFGVSERAIKRGECGTACLNAKRLPGKLFKWIKRDVDAAFEKLTKPVVVAAAEFAARGTVVKRRKSIIRKTT